MIGIRIGEEQTTICLNPKFITAGKGEFAIPFGTDNWRIRGSYGIAYSYASGHTLWFHWKNCVMPRDIKYITQAFARKRAYGFYF